MAKFEVTAATLIQKSQNLSTLNDKFKSEVDNLVTTEESLNAMWDGEANDAFHKAFTNDKTQMMNFYNLIVKYCNALNQIAEKYQKAENANLSTASTRKYK